MNENLLELLETEFEKSTMSKIFSDKFGVIKDWIVNNIQEVVDYCETNNQQYNLESLIQTNLLKTLLDLVPEYLVLEWYRDVLDYANSRLYGSEGKKWSNLNYAVEIVLAIMDAKDSWKNWDNILYEILEKLDFGKNLKDLSLDNVNLLLSIMNHIDITTLSEELKNNLIIQMLWHEDNSINYKVVYKFGKKVIISAVKKFDKTLLNELIDELDEYKD